jgi:hypothetical protein
MADQSDVRRIALSLPSVEEATDGFGFSVRGKGIAWVWLYPLWPDTIGLLGHLFATDPSLDGAWGGPTLAGAWAVHATIAVGLQAICLVVLRTIYRPAK